MLSLSRFVALLLLPPLASAKVFDAKSFGVVGDHGNDGHIALKIDDGQAKVAVSTARQLAWQETDCRATERQARGCGSPHDAPLGVNRRDLDRLAHRRMTVVTLKASRTTARSLDLLPSPIAVIAP